MESSTRGDAAPGLATDNGKTPADEVAEAGEVHSAHALGSTTTPHSKREMAAWQLVARTNGSRSCRSRHVALEPLDCPARLGTTTVEGVQVVFL
jgi:hypothetical protein